MWEVFVAAIILIAFWALQVANAIEFINLTDDLKKNAEINNHEQHVP